MYHDVHCIMHNQIEKGAINNKEDNISKEITTYASVKVIEKLFRK